MKSVVNIIASDAIKACDLYKHVFDGVVGDIYEFPKRPQSNEANISIGNLHLRIIDENTDFECFSPKNNKTSPMWFQIDVKNIDVTCKKALDSGMKINTDIQEHLGQKFIEVIDEYGYTWVISQIINEVSYEERMAFYNEYHSGLDIEKTNETSVKK